MDLIRSADDYEKDKFGMWTEGHDLYRAQHNGEDEVLDQKIKSRIGFSSAKNIMREIMLKDTVDRLPEVLSSLRTDLDNCLSEQKILNERKKFTDVHNLRHV
eukprot:10105825-Ditylum_brightwellii.AAC.1